MSADSLVLFHAFFRHGERTPERGHQYPNDPYLKDEFLPYGPGQLTNIGRKTMYDLGKTLRSTYDEYLGDQYLPKYLNALATNYDRTKASLQLVLASLYPPKGENIWHDGLNWQPIPYNSYTVTGGDIFGGLAESPEFLEAYRKNFDTNGGKEFLQKHHDLVSYIMKHTGADIKYTRDLWYFAGTLQTEGQFGLVLPEWTKLVTTADWTEFVAQEYKMQTATKELKKLTVGKLLQKVVTDSKAKISGESNCKLHLYSGHDCTIVHLLMYFGVMYRHYPGFGACLVLELRKIEGKYGIKLRYKETKTSDFTYLTFPNGSDVLELDDFENMVQDLIS